MLVGAVLFSCVVVHARAEDENRSDAPLSEYETWVKPFTQHWEAENIYEDRLIPSLVITWQRYGKLDAIGKGWFPDCGFAVSEDGEVIPFAGTFSHSARLNAKSLDRFKVLAVNLPIPETRLPAEDRRIVVQVADDDGILASVYDRGNLPEEILELFRIAECRITPWMPEFKSESHWKTHSDDMSMFGLAPDGNTIVFAPASGAIKLWQVGAHALSRKANGAKEGQQEPHPTALVFSPDGAIAIVESWRTCYAVDAKTWKSVMTFEEPETGNRFPLLGHPRFMPDGNHLLLSSSDGTLRFFDTKTWEHLETFPGLPGNISDYVPAPKAQRGLALNANGTLELWDPEGQQAVAQLTTGVRIQYAAFSPDETHVVAGTGSHNDADGARIRIWNMKTGELEHELRAFEHDGACEAVTKLQWTPDGRYILGAFKPASNSEYGGQSISVWSAQTGRHCGGFAGPEGVVGFDLLPDGRQIVAGDKKGTVHIWNLASALKNIDETQRSLAGQR